MKLLGLTKSQALEYLHEHNIKYRLIERESELIYKDSMFDIARFNLTIENDLVVKVEKF